MKIIFAILTFCLIALCVRSQPIQETQKLLADDGTEHDEFGNSVSISGDYLVIGASYANNLGNNSGAAYIYLKDAGIWVQQAKLTPSDFSDGAGFGFSVCMYNDYLIIGKLGDEVFGEASGSAYIFYKDNGNWIEQAKLIPSDGAACDFFGQSVAIGDGFAIVGAPFDDDHGGESGSAYIFKQIDEIWVQQTKIIAPDGEASDFFGQSVSISGSVVIIGAYSNNQTGSAYIYKNDGNNWVQETKLMPSDGSPNDSFGYSVSLSDDRAIVGAANNNNIGAAYIFNYNGNSWVFNAKVYAFDGSDGDSFGKSVSILGNQILVGAPYDDDIGSAYLFINDGVSWNQSLKLIPSDGSIDDYFGRTTSLSTHYSLIGASGNDDYGDLSGSAYIYRTSTANVQENSGSEIRIYPNPTRATFQVESTITIIGQIIISNLFGKTIFKKSDIGNKEKIDLSNYPSGIYVISIQTDKNIFVNKITKE